MGEALNEDIMQNEECIENGTLINKISFCPYLTRSQCKYHY